MTENTPDDLPGGDARRGGDLVPPAFGVPATALRRFRATVLDPDTAERLGDEPAPQPVAYVPHRLLIPGFTAEQLEGHGSA